MPKKLKGNNCTAQVKSIDPPALKLTICLVNQLKKLKEFIMDEKSKYFFGILLIPVEWIWINLFKGRLLFKLVCAVVCGFPLFVYASVVCSKES